LASPRSGSVSPEFVNRIDVVVTYQPLDAEAMAKILDHHRGAAAPRARVWAIGRSDRGDAGGREFCSRGDQSSIWRP
jgi:hypothetical protein